MESLQLQEGAIAGEMLGDVDEQVMLPADVDKQVKVSDVVDGQVHHFVQEGEQVHYSDDVGEQKQKWDAMEENKQIWDAVDEIGSQLHGTEENSRSMRPPPASIFTEDLLAEILSRVPYSSLCRFKCVSRSWLALCSDPAIRRRSSQTLSGFFYRLVTYSHLPFESRLQFTNVSGRGRPMLDPSLPFMPACKKIEVISSSNGLLLCHCMTMSPEHEYDYVVCNPAIEKWIMLPHTEAMDGFHTARLGSDPAVSSHFAVFLIVNNLLGHYCEVAGVEVYSSKTGAWTYRQSEWGDDCRVHDATKSVFFNGIMHFTTADCSVATMDMELNKWRKIPTPHHTVCSLIALSRGRLCLLQMDYRNDCDLSVWALEDYAGEQWILRYSVSKSRLFEGFNPYALTAIHPERNMFFFTKEPGDLVAYDMDSRIMHTICTPPTPYRAFAYQPYIPCFAKWLSDEH